MNRPGNYMESFNNKYSKKKKVEEIIKIEDENEEIENNKNDDKDEDKDDGDSFNLEKYKNTVFVLDKF